MAPAWLDCNAHFAAGEKYHLVILLAYADRVGCWQDHVLSWLRLHGGSSSFKLIRYEDLVENAGR
jgi:hypothetical protein